MLMQIGRKSECYGMELVWLRDHLRTDFTKGRNLVFNQKRRLWAKGGREVAMALGLGNVL
jgi:hypothetical protein